MGSFWVTVMYSWISASMLVALVILGWLNATVEREDAPGASAPRIAATGRMHRH